MNTVKKTTENDNFDKNGKFANGNQIGQGRPKGSKNKFTLIKEQMVEVWEEEGGKERFRELFRGSKKEFLQALDRIIAILPKESMPDPKADETKMVIILPETREF